MAIAPAMTANSQTGTFQVMATTAAASGPAAFNLTNVPGTANKLVFVQQPVGTVAGATITPAVTVQVQDSSGNAVHTAGVPVTLQAQRHDPSAEGIIRHHDAEYGRQRPGHVRRPEHQSGRQLYLAGKLRRFEFGYQPILHDHSRDSGEDPIDRRRAADHHRSDARSHSRWKPRYWTRTNNPVSGATVTFTAPGSGASATLSAPSAVDGHERPCDRSQPPRTERPAATR